MNTTKISQTESSNRKTLTVIEEKRVAREASRSLVSFADSKQAWLHRSICIPKAVPVSLIATIGIHSASLIPSLPSSHVAAVVTFSPPKTTKLGECKKQKTHWLNNLSWKAVLSRLRCQMLGPLHHPSRAARAQLRFTTCKPAKFGGINLALFLSLMNRFASPPDRPATC